MNFGKLKDTAGISTSKTLRPWDIYEVSFAGCRVETIQGKKDPAKTYKILKIRFENNSGYYEESVFFPVDADTVRPTRTNKEGHEVEMPSNFERILALIAQLGAVINPEGYKKMQALSEKFKSFDDVCATLIKITDPKKGTKTHLKLIGRTNNEGKIKAALPYFVSLNKDGEVWTSDNFIGDKLDFTAYELKQKEAYTNAVPTTMDKPSTSNTATPTIEEDEDEINLDDIDL